MGVLFLQQFVGNQSQESWIINGISFALVIVVLWYARKMFTKSKGTDSIDKFFTDGFIYKLKTIAFLTTFTECIGLFILAVERGVDPFNAGIRFTVVAFFELGLTYLFIEISSKFQDFIIRKVLADEKIEPFEVAWLIPYIIFMVPLFLFCSIPTWGIAQLYFESTGALRIVFGGLSPWIWEQVHIYETGKTVFVELGALVLIYLTPCISLTQAVIAPYYKIKSRLDEINEGEDDDDDWEDDDWEDDDIDDDALDDEVEMEDVIDDLCGLLGLPKRKVTKNLAAVLGKTGDKDATNPSITSGDKTVKEVETDLLNLFLGEDDPNDPHGLLGYNYLEEEISRITKEDIPEAMSDIDDARRALNATSSASERTKLKKALIEAEEKKDKLKKEVSKKTGLMKGIKKDLLEHCKESGLYSK
jgi:hypothetical protein